LLKLGTNTIGDIARTAATAIALLNVLYDLDSKDDGVYDLDNCFRNTSLTANRYRTCTKVSGAFSGFEDIDVAFTAKQYNVLFQYGNALEFLRSAVDASFKIQLDIKSNGNGVKAVIKLYRFNIDICPADFCALYAHVTGVLNDLLTKISQINANVFKAITISARIQDSVGFNTNSFLGVAGIACKSVFRHSNTSVV
jgi:hypothetical protein